MRHSVTRIAGLLTVLWAASVLAHAEGMWQGIPFGASVDEALARGKEIGVSRVDNPKRIPPGPAAPNGLYDPLRIGEYEISGARYKVSLVFDAKTDQLWGVVLTFAGHDARSESSSLAQALTEKYGKPASVRNDGSSMQEQIWHDKQARIRLTYVPVASHLQLSYEPPSRASNGKL